MRESKVSMSKKSSKTQTKQNPKRCTYAERIHNVYPFHVPLLSKNKMQPTQNGKTQKENNTHQTQQNVQNPTQPQKTQNAKNAKFFQLSQPLSRSVFFFLSFLRKIGATPLAIEKVCKKRSARGKGRQAQAGWVGR